MPQSSFKERQRGMESRQKSLEVKRSKARRDAEVSQREGSGAGGDEEGDEEEGLLGGLIQFERDLDVRAVAVNVACLAALLAAGVWTFQNAPLKNSNVLLAAAGAFGVIMCKKRKERDQEASSGEGKGGWFYPSITIIGGTMLAGRLVGAFLARLFAGLPQCDMIVALTPIVGGFLGATFLR